MVKIVVHNRSQLLSDKSTMAIQKRQKILVDYLQIHYASPCFYYFHAEPGFVLKF